MSIRKPRQSPPDYAAYQVPGGDLTRILADRRAYSATVFGDTLAELEAAALAAAREVLGDRPIEVRKDYTARHVSGGLLPPSQQMLEKAAGKALCASITVVYVQPEIRPAR